MITTDDMQKTIGKVKTQLAAATKKATEPRTDEKLRALRKDLKRKQRKLKLRLARGIPHVKKAKD